MFALFLRDRNLLNVAYALLLVIIVLAILGSGLRRRAGRTEIWVALAILAVYCLLLVRLFLSPEERTHLIEYGVVALLIFQALAERKRHGRLGAQPAVVAIVVTALLGWLDEGIQAILPNRVYDIRDVGFNALAGLMAITANLSLNGARKLTAGTAAGRKRPESAEISASTSLEKLQ